MEISVIVTSLWLTVEKCIEYPKKDLKIAKEIGDRGGEGRANGNLGIAYRSQRDYRKSIEYQEKCQEIAIEIGDRGGEGKANGNLGVVLTRHLVILKKPLTVVKN